MENLVTFADVEATTFVAIQKRAISEIAEELAQAARDLENTKSIRDNVATQHADLDNQVTAQVFRVAALRAELLATAETKA